MRTVADTRQFKDLAVGEEFRLSRYSQSGLLADLSKPGDVIYRKKSARTYERVVTGTHLRVGSIKARTWPV